MSAPIERPLRLAREQRASSPSSRESAAVLEASGVRLRASGDVLRDDSRTRERPPLRGGRGRAHVPQLRRTCRASVLVRDSPTFPYCYVGRVRCHARPHARSHCDRREPESAQCRGAACCAPTSARANVVDHSGLRTRVRLAWSDRTLVQVGDYEANQRSSTYSGRIHLAAQLLRSHRPDRRRTVSRPTVHHDESGSVVKNGQFIGL